MLKVISDAERQAKEDLRTATTEEEVKFLHYELDKLHFHRCSFKALVREDFEACRKYEDEISFINRRQEEILRKVGALQ